MTTLLTDACFSFSPAPRPCVASVRVAVQCHSPIRTWALLKANHVAATDEVALPLGGRESPPTQQEVVKALAHEEVEVQDAQNLAVPSENPRRQQASLLQRRQLAIGPCCVGQPRMIELLPAAYGPSRCRFQSKQRQGKRLLQRAETEGGFASNQDRTGRRQHRNSDGFARNVLLHSASTVVALVEGSVWS